MKKLFLAALLPLLLVACDYQPYKSESESSEEQQEERFDPTTIDYNYIELDNEYTGLKREKFLATAYKKTKKAKRNDVVAYMESVDEETGLGSSYNFEGYNIFYDNKVAETYLGFDESYYSTTIQFIRNGEYYEYDYSVDYDEVRENMDHGETAKTDLWDCFDFPLACVAQDAFEDEDTKIGTYNGEVISLYSKEYVNVAKINHKEVNRHVQEQCIITYVDDRVSTIIYFYKTSVKYDFEEMQPSTQYSILGLDQVHMKFNYDTEVGNFDSDRLQEIIDLAN